MMELTINNVVYQFVASFGFLRKVNQTAQQEIAGTGKKQDVGLKFMVAALLDGSTIALLDVLDSLNLNQTPRVTKQDLEVFLEDPETDVDALFEEVLDFLSRSNVTKKEVSNFLKEVEKKMAEETKQ